jgi:hypothetical protein
MELPRRLATSGYFASMPGIAAFRATSPDFIDLCSAHQSFPPLVITEPGVAVYKKGGSR